MASFPYHFDLAEKYDLPMYLHSRNTQGDFAKVVKENRHKFGSGVVHSFDGTLQDLSDLLAMDLFIGINGCSLKTEENLQVVKAVPLSALMIETDCPFCEIKNTSPAAKLIKTKFVRVDKKKYDPEAPGFSLVKDRNEPVMLVQVVEVIAAVKNISVEEVAEATYQNTMKMFQL